MTISIVLPYTNQTGGIQVLATYAQHLQARDHRVALYAPILPYRFCDKLLSTAGLRRWAGDLRLNLIRRTNVPWKALAGTVPVRLVPWIDGRFLPSADVVIASAWPTAYSVAGLPERCGARVYFIQHHEIWSGPAAAVEGSYALPLQRIVIASWLEHLMIGRWNLPVLANITNGVDCDQFSPAPVTRPADAAPTVVMQYSSLAWKGMADGFAAWGIVRRRIPAARLVLFGLEPGASIPRDATFHRAPTRTALAEIYRNGDVFVSPSWSEGCQLPPMEAMACRCAVVATNVGGVPDYAIAGQTAIVVEPRDVQGLAGAITDLLLNPEKRAEIADNGYRHIQQFTWDRASGRLEQALQIACSAT